MVSATLPLGTRGGAIVPLTRPARRASRFGDYDVVTPLARGGMGGVYLAVHTWTDEQAPDLVMEYLSGETLGTIADRGPIDLPSIIAICARAAAALAALHDVGVIHCDVKHDNLFVLDRHLDGWPRVKVIDFGVSRLVDEPPHADPSVGGTPWCIAPEQWRGKPCPASDVYGLGCLLYDLPTGPPPFDGSLPELMAAHLERRPSRPSWVRRMPIELERVILRSLAKRPGDRPTMHEVAVRLDALADARPARRAG